MIARCVLPYENEGLNECWLADKERFSYQGLNSAERLTRPMVKQGGTWREVDWNVALDYASHALRDVVKNHGAAALGSTLLLDAGLRLADANLEDDPSVEMRFAVLGERPVIVDAVAPAAVAISCRRFVACRAPSGVASESTIV